MAAIAVLFALLMTSLGYAVLKYTATVSNTAMIKGYQITLWRTDTNVAVTSITWGDLETGTSKDTETILGFTQQLKIKNTGDYDCYAGWKLDPTTPLPQGVTLTAEGYKNGGWQTWTQNDMSMFPLITINGLTAYPVRWTLTVASDASRGSLTFNILLLATNSV
jgi:hypothetical protein